MFDEIPQWGIRGLVPTRSNLVSLFSKCSLKNAACMRQFWSYRGTFEIPKGSWTTVQLPFSDFRGHGDGIVDTEFDTATLRRLGVVAIGKQMEVTIALASIRFIKK